jgi:hypothetical protein
MHYFPTMVDEVKPGSWQSSYSYSSFWLLSEQSWPGRLQQKNTKLFTPFKMVAIFPLTPAIVVGARTQGNCNI